MAARARDLGPYVADGVPGWFQAVLRLSDSSGKELAYNDDFRGNPDPVLYFAVPEDGEYVLAIGNPDIRSEGVQAGHGGCAFVEAVTLDR